MPRIPFAEGFKGEDELPRTWRLLKNCWRNGQGNIIPRPGISTLSTTGKVARGNFVWNGSMYQVVSTDLIKVTDKSTGAFSVIGTIEGAEAVEVDVGFNHAVIVVSGGKLYTLSKTDTLADISSNPNIVPSVDVTHIKDRFVYIPADGTPAFFSDVGAAGTVQVDSFFDAGELPDSNKASINIKDTLYIFGSDSIQPFRDTGASPVPYRGVQGARIPAGYLGGLLEYEDTALFIGRKKGQSLGIFALAQGGATRISNTRIDLILQKYTVGQLAETVASRFIWNGYDIATFSIGEDSFGFFGGEWFLLDTLFGGTLRAWGGGYITQFENEYFTAFEDKIGKLDKVNKDYGERISRCMETAFEQEDNKKFSVQSLEVGVSQGYNSSIGSMALQTSRDGVLWGPPVYRNLGEVGKYTDRLEWNPPGGLGNFQGYVGIRLYTTEDINFTADHMQANFR